MTPKKTILVILAIALVACGRSGKMQRGQQNYDVVQEGSAGGVTSTINAPGETPPPPSTTAPMTNTSADTTTAFTLPGQTATTGTNAGTIAGTLPTSTQPTTRREPRIPRHEQPNQVPMSSGSTSTSEPPTTGGPTTTDTTATTSTQPPTTTDTRG